MFASDNNFCRLLSCLLLDLLTRKVHKHPFRRHFAGVGVEMLLAVGAHQMDYRTFVWLSKDTVGNLLLRCSG